MVATVSQPVYVEDGDGLKLMGVVGCDVTMEEIIQAMKLNRLKIYNVSQRIVDRCQKKNSVTLVRFITLAQSCILAWFITFACNYTLARSVLFS